MNTPNMAMVVATQAIVPTNTWVIIGFCIAVMISVVAILWWVVTRSGDDDCLTPKNKTDVESMEKSDDEEEHEPVKE